MRADERAEQTGRHDDIELHGTYWTLAGDTNPAPIPGREWSRFSLEERVELAAEVGFEGFGLWHADLQHIMREKSLAEIAAIFDDYGIDYIELEFLGAWFLDESDERRQAAEERWQLLLQAAEALDAHHIKVGNIRGFEAPRSQVATAFERLCQEAARHGTSVGLEIMPVDPNVTSLDEAAAVTGAPSNGGILLDTWHISKMEISMEDLTQIDRDNLVHVELNDGYNSGESITYQTTRQRMLPGEGTFDVSGFIDSVQEIGYDDPWGVEVLSDYLRGLPIEAAFQRTYDQTMAQF
ncbi:sugar phosphate isomerase/epimerase family protein [Halarchaeum nitratireducens]|uniref:sugar phosphate isomerase/epimerase family protein n=1 Tax=Halarchaeum nitratireducens TaxID=489913 RepID=UPI0016654746|nr:sugar phosphate isomerase/epimerase [Halarchaeum nitratireducens]